LSWELLDNLEALKVAVEKILAKLSQKVIASVTGWDFILEALSVSGI
jgi:putative transposase